MFKYLSTRLQIEKSHFLKLSTLVRQLLYSYLFYLVSYPIMGVFINVYFWRQSNDITLIAAYNLGFFLFLPITFYLNGLLLRSVSILRLYWLGVFTQGLAAALAIFFPNLSFDRVLLYGAIYGVGGGLYWANKNYITLKLTKQSNRLYYNSLETSIELISSILLPVVVGWGIVLGDKWQLYSVDTAYKFLIMGALVLLYLSGYVLQKSDIYSEKIDHLLPQNPSPAWKRNRLLVMLYYVVAGANYFIPTLLTLLFIGREGELGTLESVSAILTAILMYVVGRKVINTHKAFIISALVFVLSVILLNLYYGPIGTLLFTFISSMSLAVNWNLIYANSMEVMDKEQDLNPGSNQYALVLDNEIYFNIGRILGMAILFGVYVITSQELALRYAPLLLALMQLPMIWLLSQNTKYLKSSTNQ